MPISTKILLLILIVNFSFAKLRFKVRSLSEGAVLEETEGKDKFLNKNIGEDNIATTPEGLVVSDGVGGCEFSSFYASKVLTTSLAGFFIDEAMPKDGKDMEYYHTKLVTSLAKSMTEYQRHFNRYTIDHIGKDDITKDQIKYLVNNASISATIVSAQIDNSESSETSDEAKLMIFTKGDSLLTIFRKTEHPTKPGHFYYKPVVMTSDQQHQFNQPFQFNNVRMLSNVNEDALFREQILKDDIVILGSDGIYDNVHLSFMTYLVNLCVWLAHSESLSKEELLPILQYMADKYMDLLFEHFQDINQHLTKAPEYKEPKPNLKVTEEVKRRYAEAYPDEVKLIEGEIEETYTTLFERFPDLLANIQEAAQEVIANSSELDETASIISTSENGENTDSSFIEEENELMKSIDLSSNCSSDLDKSAYKSNKILVDLGLEEDLSEDETDQRNFLLSTRRPINDIIEEDEELFDIRKTYRGFSGNRDMLNSRYFEDEQIKSPSKFSLDDLEEVESVIDEEEVKSEFEEAGGSDSDFSFIEEEDYRQEPSSIDRKDLSGSWTSFSPNSKIRTSPKQDEISNISSDSHFSDLDPVDFEELPLIAQLDQPKKEEGSIIHKLSLKERKLAGSKITEEVLAAEITKINEKPNQPQLSLKMAKKFFNLNGINVINDYFVFNGLTPSLSPSVFEAITDTFAFKQKHIDTVFQKVDPSAFAAQMALTVKYIYKEDLARPQYRILSPFYQRWYLLKKKRLVSELVGNLTKKDDISVIAGFVEKADGPNSFKPTLEDINKQFEATWKSLEVHVHEFITNKIIGRI